MATPPQNEWNRSRPAGQRPTRGDENSIVLKPIAGAPTCSWWICANDAAFVAQHRRELPRITRSAMAKTLRPILLGGRLP